MSRLAFTLATITAFAIASANILAAENFKNGGVEAPYGLTELADLTFRPRLDCEAYGTPIDFPDDIVVTNDGPGFVSAGTTIRWQMDGGNHGIHVLPALAPKQSTFIFSVNPGGIPTGRKCTADIVRSTETTPVR